MFESSSVIPEPPEIRVQTGGGVGGNPLVYLAFLNGQGQPVSSEFLLGRCNKL